MMGLILFWLQRRRVFRVHGWKSLNVKGLTHRLLGLKIRKFDDRLDRTGSVQFDPSDFWFLDGLLWRLLKQLSEHICLRFRLDVFFRLMFSLTRVEFDQRDSLVANWKVDELFLILVRRVIEARRLYFKLFFVLVKPLKVQLWKLNFFAAVFYSY